MVYWWWFLRVSGDYLQCHLNRTFVGKVKLQNEEEIMDQTKTVCQALFAI